ncbi:MAG TPA: cysteine desulfurase [Leptospiraceae bacterium]|nr:cysteine desulfurase [Leptospiraceae bacterium]HMY68092.1 cysteine desulfurase [Leptospiraceae bacterium]HNF13262.1 cysteine desulfurase [Leptospiraceae bacterium]HNF25505.1 cysteine desulfurase [Leptospiraceae bacterium]HNM02151.1 cysteine desulfurase [Leptospiraceae bacterium]
MLDPYEIKKDFPILHTTMNGKPLVFLDSAASSQRPSSVIEAIRHYYEFEHANIHRGVYYLSQKATEKYEQTRIHLADFIGAKCAKVAIFTRNTTESINLVAQTWGRQNIWRGDEIVLTELEHHSNLVPWQMLAEEKNAKIKYIPIREDATLDLSRLDEIITDRTKLVAVSQMSNAVGTIHDIEPIIKKAHSVGAVFLLDGAQGACHLKTDVEKLGVDFYAFSAHKMLGPTGVGVLYGKEEILEKMPPWMGGGDMISDVSLQRTTYADLPARLEAGTPNIAGVISFRAAVQYLEKIGLEEIHKHEMSLVEYALGRLEELGGIKLYGPKEIEKRGGVVSFNVDGVHAHDVGSILDEEGIAIRVGHHCCQPYMKKNGIAGTCRASFYLYNTKEDVDSLIQGVKKVKEIFSRVTQRRSV